MSTYLAVVVPAYDEANRILPSLKRLNEYYSAQDYTWSVTVVSDGSKDGTNEIVAEFCKHNSNFHLLAYSPNRGKGYAVRKGMQSVEGVVLLFCDADLATPQEETESFYPRSRVGRTSPSAAGPLKTSKLEKRQPFYREMLGRAANLLIQVLGVRGIKDTQCGFKMFTRAAAHDVFSRCKFNGFSFDFEALMIAQDLNKKIAEVPIRWSHQEGSKVVLWRDIPRALRDLVKLRIMGKKKRLEPSAD